MNIRAPRGMCGRSGGPIVPLGCGVILSSGYFRSMVSGGGRELPGRGDIVPGSHLYLQHSHNSASLSELTHAERRLWGAFRFERGVDLDFGDPESEDPDRVEVCGQFIAELLSQERQ